MAWAELHIELDFFSREQLRQKEDKRGRTREYQIVNHYSGKWLPLSQASVLVDFVNLEILVNYHVYELLMIDKVGNILLHGLCPRAVGSARILLVLMSQEYHFR